MAKRTAQKRSRIGSTNRLLIEARLNKGWTPNDLARVAKVSGNTVRAAEAGFYVDPRSQFALATAVGQPVLDVFPIERQKEYA